VEVQQDPSGRRIVVTAPEYDAQFFVSGSCPVEAQGTVRGRAFRLHARHDAWTFAVVNATDCSPAPTDAESKAFNCSGEYANASWMTLEEAVALTVRCLQEYTYGGGTESLSTRSHAARLTREWWTSFLRFLFLNLMAAYSPGFLWIPTLPGTRTLNEDWALLLYSPIFCCPLSESPFFLGVMAFVAMITLTSAIMHRWSPAWFIVPVLIAVLSLLQGFCVAALFSGLNGI
jgi:hypothetical protein